MSGGCGHSWHGAGHSEMQRSVYVTALAWGAQTMCHAPAVWLRLPLSNHASRGAPRIGGSVRLGVGLV